MLSRLVLAMTHVLPDRVASLVDLLVAERGAAGAHEAALELLARPGAVSLSSSVGKAGSAAPHLLPATTCQSSFMGALCP